MSAEDSHQQAGTESIRDQVTTVFPRVPQASSWGPVIWASLGVAHGAWLIQYDVFPADYVVFAAGMLGVIFSVISTIE